MLEKNSSKNKNVLLFFALMALSFNLRSHLTALPSVISDLQQSLGISATIAGLITSIPVLCFAILSPVASLVISKLSTTQTTISLLIGIAIGVFIRSIGSVWAVFAGTVILGFSLTIGNIICLIIIADDFNDKKNMITGLYVAAMSISSMITSAATASIARHLEWRLSLCVWDIFPLIAIALWVAVAIRTSKVDKERCPEVEDSKNIEDLPAVYKRFPVYLLAIAFGCHTSLFYGLTAWLPSYLTSTLGMTDSYAGIAASIFQIAGLIGCFGIPALSALARLSRRTQFLIVATAWFIIPVGLISLPQLWLIWCLIGGIGSGGGFTVVFGLVMDQAVNLDDNRNISAFVQGVGYAFAAVCPTLLGSLKESSGTWLSGFLALAIMAVVMIICGMWSSKLSEKA
ncbi:MAG: MFS transporter [Spirochaetales bacterium]|nr:MFS transporter [Spirochaetales bacterium]